MQLTILAMGKKMVDWIELGVKEYEVRFTKELPLRIKSIPLRHRSKHSLPAALIQQEGEAMLAAISSRSHVVALDISGSMWSTEQLAGKVRSWKENHSEVTFLVGGPEGLAPKCKQRANESWALSPLTLPHPMVRIILAETLYRASSLLKHHPYHRNDD